MNDELLIMKYEFILRRRELGKLAPIAAVTPFTK